MSDALLREVITLLVAFITLYRSEIGRQHLKKRVTTLEGKCFYPDCGHVCPEDGQKGDTATWQNTARRSS